MESFKDITDPFSINILQWWGY